MKIRLMLGVCGVLSSVGAAFAAPPSNDTCATPSPISGAGIYAFNTTDGVFNGDHDSCDYSDSTAADIWYLYTAQTTGTAEIGSYINTDCGAAQYIQASVYSGLACGGTALICQEDICGYQSLRLRVTQNSQYLLRLTTYVRGAGQFGIVEQPEPDNERCSSATPVGPGSYTWNTQWAWADAPYPTCGLANDPTQRDVWFAYTAASTGNAAVDVGTNTGTTIAVFSGSCAGPQISCGGFNSGLQGKHWAGFAVTSGQTYLIRLAVGGSSFHETQPLNIREYSVPANDTCTQVQAVSANVLTSSEVSYNYNNAGAIDTGPAETASGCGLVSGSIWYKFTAPQAGIAIFRATADTYSNLYTAVSLFSSCNDASLMSCGVGYINIGVTAGQTVYVRVTQNITAAYYNDFYRTGALTAVLVPPIPNDTCANPTPLATGTIAVNNLEAVTNAAPPSLPTCASPNALTHDLWYSWTSPNPGTLILNTCNTDTFGLYDSALAVYTSCGGAPIACDDNNAVLGSLTLFAGNGDACTDNQSTIEMPTAENTTYLVRVSGYPWGVGKLHVAFAPSNNNFLSTATAVQAAPGGQPTTINGRFTTASQVDIYKIRICDVDSFMASTVYPGTTCDTRLYLFDANGYGVTQNDNASGGILASTLTDEYFNDEGDYYLAVCGGAQSFPNAQSRRPISSGGEIWTDFYPNHEVDPDGPGSDEPVIGWVGFNHVSLSPSYPANYQLVLEGICSTCAADFNGDNTRDVADLFAYINAWLAKTANANFNGDGSVDVADLFAYINAWLAGC